MEWTLDKPKQNGYYWMWSPTRVTIVIQVCEQGRNYYEFGDDYPFRMKDSNECAFYGPIHPPPIPMMLGKE